MSGGPGRAASLLARGREPTPRRLPLDLLTNPSWNEDQLLEALAGLQAEGQVLGFYGFCAPGTPASPSSLSMAGDLHFLPQAHTGALGNCEGPEEIPKLTFPLRTLLCPQIQNHQF